METKLLIKGIQKGDRQCGKKLYEAYAMYVLSICRRYHVDTELAKDYMQDVFSKAFTSLHTYDSEKGEFKYWLRRIAINHILKKKSRKSLLEHSLDVDFISVGVEPKSESKMNVQDIMDVLKKMPERYAVVFNLFVIDGYSSKEIGEKLSMQEGTVRSYVNRGRNWAKANLKKAVI